MDMKQLPQRGNNDLGKFRMFSGKLQLILKENEVKNYTTPQQSWALQSFLETQAMSTSSTSCSKETLQLL